MDVHSTKIHITMRVYGGLMGFNEGLWWFNGI
jgi:hypothetical protein